MTLPSPLPLLSSLPSLPLRYRRFSLLLEVFLLLALWGLAAETAHG